MSLMEQLAERLSRFEEVELFWTADGGVLLWRDKCSQDIDHIYSTLSSGLASKTVIENKHWLRHVAANPNMDIEQISNSIEKALLQNSRLSER